MPWVIAEVGTRLFGLNCSAVREMVIMPEICHLPGLPHYIRGVINLRGRVTPVMDLRRRFGMPSSGEESEALCRLMEQRAQDHRRWLEELEASVREKREFTLATDPHKCAFGRWYDSFKTGHVVLSGFLKKFDAPHKRIHALAGQVMELVAQGRAAEAMEALERTRNGDLSAMLRLFAGIQHVIRDSRREIAVVVDSAAGAYAISVDSVASVERLSEVSTEELAGEGLEMHGDLVTSVAKRAQSDGLVLTLAAHSIFAAAQTGAV